jgi:hypothetical protein
MKSPLIFVALATVAALPLAACNNSSPKPEVVDTNPDPMAAELANRPKVELPPAMTASKTFRCADNSLVYVDFYAGNKMAILKTKQDASPIRLTAEKDGDPLTANGYTVKGTPSSISYTAPDKKAQTCKA